MIEPDCDITAIEPVRGVRTPVVTTSDLPGAISEFKIAKQSGPTSRTPWRRAVASASASSVADTGGSTGPEPLDMIATAPAPACPDRSITSNSSTAGTETTTRSVPLGMSGPETPPSDDAARSVAPSNPAPARRVMISAAPSAPWSPNPMTATDSGSSHRRTDVASARRPRRTWAATDSLVGSMSNAMSTTPSSMCVATS